MYARRVHSKSRDELSGNQKERGVKGSVRNRGGGVEVEGATVAFLRNQDGRHKSAGAQKRHRQTRRARGEPPPAAGCDLPRRARHATTGKPPIKCYLQQHLKHTS